MLLITANDSNIELQEHVETGRVYAIGCLILCDCDCRELMWHLDLDLLINVYVTIDLTML